MSVNLRQIHHFVTLVEEGSLGRAAKIVHLTQPALSKSIRQLERLVGARLVDRTPQGVIPTAFGEAFLEHARAMRAEMAQARAHIDALKGVRTGMVSVGTGPSMAMSILPDAISRLRRGSPAIVVNVMVELSTVLTQKLMTRELDLVVATKLDPSGESNIEDWPLYLDRCVIVRGPDHELRERDDLALEELCEYQWVMSSRGELLRDQFEWVFRQREMAPPPVTVTTNSASLMRSVIAQSDLLGFLPLRMIGKDVEAGRLFPVHHDLCQWERTIFVSHRKGKSLSPVSEALLEHLRGVTGETK